MDTNLLVYMFDTKDSAKQATAQRTFAEAAPYGTVSSQVLSEFYVVTTTKMANPLPKEIAGRVVAEMGRLEVVAVDDTLVTRAIEISDRHVLSYWDSLIVAAAERGGCDTLLTEDLNDGQDIEGVKVQNPFSN